MRNKQPLAVCLRRGAGEDGDIVQLVECNVDPRCDDLPEPEEGEDE